ncbi:MAG: TM1802 family CRISPR-associated protein [Athalassotoga sp.]
MGFLNAVYDLGNKQLSGIESFLQLPLQPGGKEIRVYLKADNFDEKPLKILSVSKVDTVDFMSGEQDTEKWKLKYLYRDPVGPNASWKFTPIIKIGKPKKNYQNNYEDFAGHKDKNGKAISWREDTKSYFFKLKNKTLIDYEESGYFAAGSVDAIMNGLENQVGNIIEKFTENAPYMIVLGIDDGGHFLYPGDIPIFVDYFKEKFDNRNRNLGSNKSKGNKRCAMCGKEAESTVNLNEIFNFATFDKKSFLPALDENAHSKVFPICKDCFAMLSSGRERLDREFLDQKTLPGTNIWCIPEIIGPDLAENQKMIINQFRNFIQNDAVQSEKAMFDGLAEFMNANLVFHFVFWEKPKGKAAQELVHLMIEDVPPTRLRRIEKIWEKSLKIVESKKGERLSSAIKTIYFTLNNLGKDDNERKVLKDIIVKTIGKILNGEKVNVESIKLIFVQKFSQLLHPSKEQKINPYSEIKDMFLVIDFLSSLNEEVNK